MTKNQLSYWDLQTQKKANEEIKRSNLAKEQETNRANLRNEELKDKEIRLKSVDTVSKFINNRSQDISNIARGVAAVISLL
jgi:hypothetical protein